MSNLITQFAASMTIEQSSRSQVLMLMGFFGYSGGGKTVTALIAATGLVGPNSKIGIVDTEQRRSGLASDIVRRMAVQRYGKAPEFVAIYLEAPFHPLKYVAAVRKLQEAGCNAICVDSMTHSWAGEGGYLDMKEEAITRMAGDDWAKREKCSQAAAARVKPSTHSKLVDALLHLRVPVILCFRGKEKTKFDKNQDGRIAPKKDEFASPIHEGTLIYEMLISGEVVSNSEGIGGFCHFVGPLESGRKHSHPDILKLLPPPDQQFSFDHAEAIAKWSANPGSSDVPSDGVSAPGKKALLTELRAITEPVHKWNKSHGLAAWEKAKETLEGWLIAKGIMGEGAHIGDLAPERLLEVVNEAKAAMKTETLL